MSYSRRSPVSSSRSSARKYTPSEDEGSDEQSDNYSDESEQNLVARLDRLAPDEWKSLPQSIYGAAMMAAIRSAAKASHNADKSISVFDFGVSISVFIAMVLNVFVQAYVLIETKKFITYPAVLAAQRLYGRFHATAFVDGQFDPQGWEDFGDERDELCQLPFSQPRFFMVLLVIWTASCTVELKESWGFVMAFWALPAPGSQDAGHYAVIHVQDDDDDEKCVRLTHARPFVRTLVIFFILVPKIIIGLVLWWLGARWLSATPSFEDLLLNAVALAFIVELDELMYQTVVPADVQWMVDIHKIYSQHDDGPQEKEDFRRWKRQQFVSRIMELLGTLLFVLIFPYVYMHYLQQVIPDYQWDVHEHCKEHVHGLLAGRLLRAR